MKSSILKISTIAALALTMGCASSVQKEANLLLQFQNAPKINLSRAVSEDTNALMKIPESEKLTYKANYLGMNIGTITAIAKGKTVLNGRPVYQFEIHAQTNGFFSKVFKVEDKFVSYLDCKHLRVVRLEEHRREGNYKKDSTIDFDYEKGIAHFRNAIDKTEKFVKIPANVLDVVSANYVARTYAWSVGHVLEMDIYASEKVYNMFGIVKGKKEIRLPELGKQEAFLFQPYAKLDGKDVKEGSATAYFSAERNLIPLMGLVKTPIFGKASIVLSKVES